MTASVAADRTKYHITTDCLFMVYISKHCLFPDSPVTDYITQQGHEPYNKIMPKNQQKLKSCSAECLLHFKVHHRELLQSLWNFSIGVPDISQKQTFVIKGSFYSLNVGISKISYKMVKKHYLLTNNFRKL